MAELEFDDEEIDEELDTTGPEPEQDAPSTFLTRRRLIIGAVIAVVFVISAALFGLMGRDDTPKRPTIANRGQVPTAAPAQAEKTKKKKSRKKIKYVKLYDLASSLTADVLKELSFSGITFKTEQRGRNFVVYVDQDQLTEAINLLASKGLPEGAARGYALLDDTQTLGVTEFDKRIRFIRALSGELEKAIVQFRDIENAKVQIVLPEQRLFAVTQPPVTSSVLIRIVDGVEITDEVVFGIIQLVANSVENLQQENVSVIDTNGRVLSDGIFERMVLKEAGLAAGEEPEVPQETAEEIADDEFLPSPENGAPVIPDYQSIRAWYDIKQEYELALEDKVKGQLAGVLPAGSYKVAVTAELGPIEDGDVLDVRLLTTSVVINEARDDIFLDDVLKEEIFNTVAGAVGYVRGRDSILLSRGDFALLSPEEQREIEKEAGTSTPLFSGIGRFALYPLVPVALVMAYLGIQRLRRRGKKAGNDTVSLEGSDEPDFDEIKDEIDDERAFTDELRGMADLEPAALARIMEGWLAEDQAPVEVGTVDSIEQEALEEIPA